MHEPRVLALWKKVGASFEFDDGSLPTVVLSNLSSGEIACLYASIRRASVLADGDATFWDVSKAKDRGLDDVANAARLVVSGTAEPFHMAIEGVKVGDTQLPCRGIFVHRNSLEIDYRMGAEWGAEEVWGYFSWLRALIAGTSSGRLVVADDGPPGSQNFEEAWQWFMAEC